MSTHIITGNSPHGIVRFPRALTAPWGVFALGALFAIVGIACLALIRGPHDLPLLLLYLYTASRFGFGMRIAQLSAIPADVFRGPFAASMHAHTTASARRPRSEEHTSELQSRLHLVCRLLLEKKKKDYHTQNTMMRRTTCAIK